jgi:hypothetical protein
MERILHPIRHFFRGDVLGSPRRRVRLVPRQLVWKSQRWLLDVERSGPRHIVGLVDRTFLTPSVHVALSFAHAVENALNHGLSAGEAWRIAERKIRHENSPSRRTPRFEIVRRTI